MANDTRTRMLDAAEDLLQDRGYHGLALAELLERSSAPRGSLYFHFPDGKDQLVAAATRDGVERVTESLREALAEARSPGRAIRTILETSAAALAQHDFHFGSPTAPVVLDGLDSAPIADLTRHAYETWIGLFEAALLAAGVPPRRAAPLALLVEASFEGLLIISRANRDTAPMLAGAKELESIIEAAVAEQPKRRGKKS
ncbi:MAG TPA: TetR/AcrR family transcriptional regulator [Devosia sp.]